MPATHYARSGDVEIAYQVIGTGGRDLVYVPGFVSNVEVMWEDPGLAGFLECLAGFSRLIVFDKRGTGLSDPVPEDRLPGLEVRMDDLGAVLAAVGSERATLFGHSEGGCMCVLFAATHPDQVDGLILTGSFARRRWSPEYPWAPRSEERTESITAIRGSWGRSDEVEYYAPSRAGDPAFRSWLQRYFRLSASPGTAAALQAMNSEVDVTAVLAGVRVPTLLLYRTEDRDVDVEEGRFIASKIAGSRLVELPGADHLFWAGDTAPLLEEIEEFVTGRRPEPRGDRVVATVLFTDLVGSTALAASIGDRAWRDAQVRHDRVVRSEIERWRGREIDRAGDGFLALFDGPARAVRCALAIQAAVAALGLEVRCGLHTGEVEVVGTGVAGISVHTGARVAALAEPDEVLVSRTVKDLVAGSGLRFESTGAYQLKGVPDSWELFRACD
ncbi:MAG: adenylate/guanylate cyclase domain-containing protein [Acidimicrobiia bacterium]|nr:MAG: adenylate/guanylate cyclase domain-containing protein [Acidimicrobiia bacterium]